MFTRSQLVHAVLWPTDKDAQAHLIDAEGVIRGTITIDGCVNGRQLSMSIPDGFQLEVENVFVVSTLGDIIVETPTQFDTAVVTVRAERTFEARMQALEKRQKRREKQAESERVRLAQLLADNEALKKQVEEAAPNKQDEDPDVPADVVVGPSDVVLDPEKETPDA